MCGEKFNKTDIEKLLPLRMLYDTKAHLEKRGLVGLFPHFAPASIASLMHSTRVCTLCYLITIHESKLIEVIYIHLLFIRLSRKWLRHKIFQLI